MLLYTRNGPKYPELAFTALKLILPPLLAANKTRVGLILTG